MASEISKKKKKVFFDMTIEYFLNEKFSFFFKILFTKCPVFICYLKSFLKFFFFCMISLVVWSGAILFARAILYAPTVLL